ncbi:hypothetical protein [Psychrobacter sp. MES7-P7E]|uniref:hypothetical protein n=1 Tax=Psychrobacter sp. MES7-P7E TaxID=2058322 RepID=UPI000C7F5408|nr:hypothetical protein [Psychrobacter sp. MES7-P7E]PLT21113.1 hypothetical protein CXF62_11460 [Psychrobacter sp. MES7-P7E]
MAKAKNRDKRKKAAVKKANQVKAGKPEMYEGFMRIPLNNSFTSDEVRIHTEYEGDWLDRKLRATIMNEPRMFVVTAHVFMIDGKRYCATIEYQSYGGRETIPDAANMAVDAARNGSGLMDMSKTYIIVRAQKDMTKFPKEIDVEELQAKQHKKAPIMGLAQPFDYNYLFDEFVKESKA